MAEGQVGGAAGSRRGSGYVYVMKNERNGQYKIGCSNDLDRRLHDIRRQHSKKINLLGTFLAIEMNGAETVAQKAVQNDLGLVKVARNATDWFTKPRDVREEEILEKVKEAVEQQGYVYVIKDRSVGTFKIGSARNPKVVLARTKREFGHEDFRLGYSPVVADKMNGGKRAAYTAVQELGLRRMAKSRWFENPKRCSNRNILKTVEEAVEGFNRSLRQSL